MLNVFNDSVTYEVHMEMEKPDYKGSIGLIGKVPGNLYSVQADLKWGNQVEELQKTNIYAWVVIPSTDNINGSLAFKTSQRAIILNVNHQMGGNRFVSHADLEWENNAKVAVDTSLQLVGAHVLGRFYLQTPFAEIPILSVDVDHISDSEEYNSKVNIQLDKKITVATVLKKPINLRTFVATLDLETSFKDIKKVTVFINHKMGDSLASSAKLSVNKQFVHMDVNLQNATKGMKVSYEGIVDLKTSWNVLKKGLIRVSHDNNGKKFNTLASLLHNRQEYKINSSVTHLLHAKYYDNEGELTLSMPSGKVETRWNHRHAENSVATTLSANMGSNRISAKLRGTVQKDISMTLLIEAYRDTIGYSLLNSSLIVKPRDPFMDGRFSLESNGVILASANASYNSYPKIFKTGLSITIPDLNINSTVALEADHNDELHMNTRFIFDITPDLNMNIITSTIFFDSNHLAKTSIVWKTTMPGYERVKYTYEVLGVPYWKDGEPYLKGPHLKTISTLNYQVDKEIKLETLFYDVRDLFSISVVLTTTYPDVPRIEGGVFFAEQRRPFQIGAHIEAVPYLERTAVSLNYDRTSGILSDIVTPIGSVSASVKGQLSGFNSKIAIVDKFKRNYGMEFKFDNMDKFEITTIVSMSGRRDIIGKFTHTGTPTSFNCSAELTNNRKNNFLSTVSFRVTDEFTLSVAGSLRTELFSNADKFDTSLNIQGSQSKVIINGDISRNNEKTSSVDFSVNADRDVDASLSIRSPFFQNVKSSFRHIYQNNFVETKADLIYGVETKLSVFVQLSNGKTKVGEIKISTFLTEDFGGRTRVDGTWTNFVLNTEAFYGNKRSMIDLTQRVDRNELVQRITFTATGVDDISSTLSFIGDYKQMKSFAELNKGTDIHRIDVNLNNNADIEGSVSLSSPLVKPVTAIVYIKGPLTALNSHAEIKIEDKKSEIDIRFNTKPFEVLLSLKSPYINDVSVTASQKGSFPSYTATTKLSIEGIADIEAKINIVKTDKITTALEISPMNLKKIVTAVYFPDYTRAVTQKGGKQTIGASFTYGNEKSSIDVSFQFDKVYFLRVSLNSPFMEPLSASLQHEGGINSFKCHADFSLGAKTSECDVSFSNVGKTEGTLILNSVLMPKLTLGFGHSGTQTNFDAYASYKNGENTTEAKMKVNTDNKIQASLDLSLPKRSPIRIHYNHSGDISNFTCNGEVIFGQKWQAGIRFQRTNRYQGNFFFNPPTSFMEPIKLNFSLERFASGLIVNVEYASGSSKRNADLAVTLQDSKIEIKTNISCEEFLAIFNVSARSIEKSFDISSHVEFVFSLEKTEGDFKYQTSEERSYVSISLDSPFLPEIDANLMINGIPAQFNVEGNLAIDGDLSSVKLNSDVKSDTNIKIDSSISIATPYFDDIYLRLRHQYSNPKYMVLIVNSKVNSVVRDAVFSMDLNSIDNLKLYLTMNEPHFSINFSNNKTTDGRDGFAHKGFWEVYVGDKVMRVRTYVRSLDEFSLSYNLPLKNGLYDGHMEYTHNETTTRVIIIDVMQRHKIELIFKDSPELKLSIDIDWPSIPTLQSNIYLKRTQTDYTGGSSIVVDGEKKGSFELNLNGDKSHASFKLDLPKFNGLEKLSGSLNTKSKKSLQIISGSILRKSERLVEFDLKYDLKNSLVDIDISGTKPQPFSLKFSASSENDIFKTNWYLKDIEVHAGHIEFKKGQDQYSLNIKVEDYTLKIDFNNQQEELQSEITINIPNRDIISFKVRYADNRPSAVTGNVQLTWNSTMTFEFDLKLKTSSGFEGSAILKTPFPKYEYTELKGFYQGTWAPFKNTENLGVEFYQSTGDSEFKAGMNVFYATGKELKLTVGHVSKEMHMASFVAFESPFTSPIAIIANHTGKLPSDFTTLYQVKNGADSITIKVAMKYGLQSIVFSSSLTTVLEGEISEQSFKVTHDGGLDRFTTEASVKVFDQEIRLDTLFQLAPVMEASVTLLTPYTNIRNIHAAFNNSFSPNSIFLTGTVQWAENRKVIGRVDVVKNGLKHITANMEITTPFSNMEFSKISVTHSVSDDAIHCSADVTLIGQAFSMKFDGDLSPLSIRLNIKTPFKGFETIGLEGRYAFEVSRVHKGFLELTWNPVSKINLDGSFTEQPFDASVSLTTPFKALKQTALSVSHKMFPKGLREGLKLEYNNTVILDADLEHNILGKHKSALVFVRSPRHIKFEIDGDFTLECVDFDMVLDWNPLNISQNFQLNAGYDIRSNKMAAFNITGFGKVLSMDATYSERTSKANVAWGVRSSQKVGYDVSLSDTSGNFKLILPTRSIALLSKHLNGKTDVDFMWNADVNPTEKVSIRSYVVQTGNSFKADMTMGLPHLKKLYKFGSEFIVNRGRIIFDGRTEISYSADSDKTLAISCKLEDVSSASGKNYSLIFDLSHPHTTVGINVKSHIERSSTGYSSGLTLKYMTARRLMQTFSVGGTVDKLRQSISFEMKTPVKTISISGSAQTDNNFRLSLLNVYDNKRPLTTVFTIDRATRSIDFMMNFDIDRPQNEFHIRANYVNSSALQAEVYRLVDTNRIQDVLVTVRLNTSHLIHSRIHWRPEMIKDLEAFRSKKADEYENSIDKFVQKMRVIFTEELLNKKRIISDAVREEIGQENAAKFEAVVMPYFDQGLNMIVAVTEPMVQRVKSVWAQSRSKYSATMVAYKTFVNKPLLENTAVGDVMKTDLIAGIRRNVSEKFNVISEKLSVPRNLLQALASNGIVWSGEQSMQVLPKMIAEKIGHLKIGSYLESFIHTLLLDIEQDIQASLKELEDFLLTNIRSPITVWDPAHGEIQLEQYLPIPLQSLDALPILEYGQHVERLRNMIPDTIPSVSMPEVPSEWLPPFSGVATISKGQRITTFDGFVYDLKDKCTFVLARDFHNNNFTIVLTNEGDTTLSMITRTNAISVNALGEVLNGDQKVTLPATIGDLSIQGSSGLIEISNGEHFTIVYDTSVDHITVKISGWYFGKVAGLLGIYDNEPSNELVTSFNKVIDTSSRFAKTWAVGVASCN